MRLTASHAQLAFVDARGRDLSTNVARSREKFISELTTKEHVIQDVRVQ